MTDEEIERMAQLIAAAMRNYAQNDELSSDDKASIKDLLKTKRSVIKITMYVFAGLLLYALKDVWTYIMEHLSWVVK